MAIVSTASIQQVSQWLPERSQLVAQGRSWEGGLSTSVGTFVAPVMPTTLVPLVLMNGETGPSGKSYVIDRVSLMVITSSTAGGVGIITTGVISPGRVFAGATQQVAAAVFAGTVLSNAAIKSLSGKGYYAGNATIQTVCTCTLIPALAVTDWIPLAGTETNGVATTLGGVISGDCYGRHIVPPGGAIGFGGVATSAAGTYALWVTWHEVTAAQLALQ